jgi:hypothetical protein
MGRACSTHREKKKDCKDLDVGGRIILRWILEK